VEFGLHQFPVQVEFVSIVPDLQEGAVDAEDELVVLVSFDRDPVLVSHLPEPRDGVILHDPAVQRYIQSSPSGMKHLDGGVLRGLNDQSCSHILPHGSESK
jgi:hypothetical protein